MSKLEIELHDREFFLDRVWKEEGTNVRKNVSVHRNYDDALEAKRQHADMDAKMPRAPSLLGACKAALEHVQLLGSGQQSPYSHAELCSILGDAIDADDGGKYDDQV